MSEAQHNSILEYAQIIRRVYSTGGELTPNERQTLSLAEDYLAMHDKARQLQTEVERLQEALGSSEAWKGVFAQHVIRSESTVEELDKAVADLWQEKSKLRTENERLRCV